MNPFTCHLCGGSFTADKRTSCRCFDEVSTDFPLGHGRIPTPSDEQIDNWALQIMGRLSQASKDTASAINHRELLEKYIVHVGRQEGIDFIDNFFDSDLFTEDEWRELRELSETSKRFDTQP